MSNRNRSKNSKNKKKIPDKLKFRYCIMGAVVCLCLMVIVFGNVIWISHSMKTEIDNMTLGVDYFYEDITITAKDYDSYYSTPDTAVPTTNYFLYYNQHEYIIVDEDTYFSYEVGDTIKAYTKDHEKYYFIQKQLLGKRYTNNELSKGAGAMLGVIAGLFLIFAWVYKE